MASMDVTPQELRDIEIREAWRGYHRDDVDELLERAAATIEHLEAEVQQLRARAAQGAPAQAPAQASAPAPQPAPVVQAPPPVPAPVRSADTDVIQRTLVLAQKAADEAVAEARVKAQQMVGEAEHRAQQVVGEAEANAASIAERERSKLEGEIDKLQTARDTLNADVDALEQFEGDYRDRLRSAIQGELELLNQATAIGQRPALHDVELPAVSAGASWTASPAPAAPTIPPAPPEDSWSASAEGAVRPVTEPPPAGQATVHIEAVAAGEEAWDSGPAGGWNDSPTAAVIDESGEYAEVEPGAAGDSLDDDAFFASLREAVRDDAPLGTNDDDAAFFDEEDTEEHRRLFKRRK